MKKVVTVLGSLCLSLLVSGCDFIFYNVQKERIPYKTEFIDTTRGILKIAESYVAEYMIEHHGDWKSKDEFICDGVECKNSDDDTLKIYDRVPESGIIVIDKEGVASIKKSNPLIFDNYSCTTDSDNNIDCNKD